ncbi:LysR family transcriptional regulator [Streptacidiphilus jiangxiensis]|uniref:DNA-binding transcriptional regulator, LysR family n=1 Tax=Streptacidiphilus jiangxiensis TaxID=235985 RepID=A0A1H7YSX3_STRJI|nr:LysR family transcriptional regulator [Streptacidiphilus jiangxiensis]SEM48467.1 DNA-binding transcriptional regulator, LysR family [Streptacidiphilus jiangxiensis]
MDDLDLAQVRAFLAVAEQLHFRRAAEVLSLSQQGLSKRIARLEDGLGVRLFDRTQGGVRLTDAGTRFLEPARAALAAGVAAVAAVREGTRPLRLDVWGHLFDPLRTVRETLAAEDQAREDQAVEVGPGRDLPGVAAALARGEIGAGFGRFHPAAGAPDGGPEHALAHRLVRLEPVDAVLRADHPLARAEQLRPDQLTALRLILPTSAGRLDFLARFAEQFGVPMLEGGTNLGLDHLLERLRSTPDGVVLLPSELPLDPGPDLAVVPLAEPTPLYAWSLVWHRDRPDPGVPALLRAFAETGASRRWLEYRPGRDWLPEDDQAEAGRSQLISSTRWKTS